MRIAFFTAGGPFGQHALTELSRRHDVVSVVRPADRASIWRRVLRAPARRLRLRHPDVVARAAREASIPQTSVAQGSEDQLLEVLGPLDIDLICIATFPWLLNADLLACPKRGVLNLHPSLLPRHRGPNPLFWTYYHDDCKSGVTAHIATERADAGAIVEQAEIPIERGWPSSELYMRMATVGAEVLSRAVDRLAAGPVEGTPQDESLVTQAPRVVPGSSTVDFEDWDVERVWHFLKGLNPWYQEGLQSEKGQPVRYGEVLGFERAPPSVQIGRARRTAAGWQLQCRDGIVQLSGPRRLPRLVPRS